jgi:hypothetical protein
MPGFVMTTAAVLTCLHQGPVTITPSGPPRVLMDGVPVVGAADQMMVACPKNICANVVWGNLAARVLADGQPIVLQAVPPAGSPVTADGVCVPPVPPASPPALVDSMIPRAIAT